MHFIIPVIFSGLSGPTEADPSIFNSPSSFFILPPPPPFFLFYHSFTIKTEEGQWKVVWVDIEGSGLESIGSHQRDSCKCESKENIAH